MHLGSLPGLLLALAWGLLGGTSAHQISATGVHAGLNNTAVYSILKQAETPTVTTDTTTISPTATLAVIATDTVSATGTITPEATLTPTQIPSTPIPLPTAAPVGAQGGLQLNPLDWRFLTSAPRDPAIKMGPFAYVYLILMLGLIGGGIYGYRVLRPRFKNTNTVWYKAVARFAQPAIWIGVIGLLFLLARLVELDFFNMRLWFYLTLVAALGLAGWFFYWYRDSYPKEIAKFQKTQKQKQYLPGQTRGSARTTPGASTSAPTTPSRTNRPRKKK